jgi:endonuclease/exonuclease/phosphatase family metal-dependent hydrolase
MSPPTDVVRQLGDLRVALDRDVPPKAVDRNLLVATWRWGQLWDLDPVWTPSPRSRATWRTVECFAEVIRRFDIVGIQGVMTSSAVLQAVLARLGPHWSYTMTLLEGPTTYKERTALIFDRRRATSNGLSGQLVLSDRAKQGESFESAQFYRPPQYATFTVPGGELAVVNIHLVFGAEAERAAEMLAFLGAVRRVAADDNVGIANTIALGQLQLVSTTSTYAKALVAAGMRIPKPLRNKATFLNGAGKPATMASSIVWFKSRKDGLDQRLLSAGVFNHVEHLGQDTDMTAHLPAWVELAARPLRW